ncbi:XRE family transcriptional regulator [Methanomicrobiaceae archaeon CYW5]|uniref:helix-turn-helix transcriptional regulator n=1 Tax=Methanovulcanius yangii TaxID=1789227 RepID=UPI0029C9C4F8|nr:helix-turn-helix transcriptional regulator [Methanovulcanius yangii]MBT8508400.1 XRE family transcriptional regulator [Methanovulcanius yangii]
MQTKMKEFRARHGITQADLADRVGVRRETIVHLEKGTYTPSLRLAWQIACELETTVDELFSFDDEVPQNGQKKE